ncbi:MAG: CoA activase, partial [Fibrobacter sp.]|nr:CoA activase [Fibrobacter sp.]
LYHTPFVESDKTRRKILTPNLSPAFSVLASEYIKAKGFMAEYLPVADKEAIELGKKFVHNDICFPCQVNIGECLKWLVNHPEIKQTEVSMCLAKNCENCRAVQYPVLARKALDEAGFKDVSIITTGTDYKGIHPGFSLGLDFRLHMLWGIVFMDAIEIMYRALLPYEVNKGDTQKVYDHWMPLLMSMAAQLKKTELRMPKKVLDMFGACVDAFNTVEITEDRKKGIRKPRVAVLGEILMNYHPSANGFVEKYLMDNGMEVYLPGMLDFFRVDEVVRGEKLKRGFSANPLMDRLEGGITSKAYERAYNCVQDVMKSFKLYEHHADCYELINYVSDIIDPTYNTGEGWLIPGEILYNSKHGINSYIILQPFACLANHISGRGLTKAVKERCPHVQILSLDYDPDTSFANIENRLQMLIINARELEKANQQ